MESSLIKAGREVLTYLKGIDFTNKQVVLDAIEQHIASKILPWEVKHANPWIKVWIKRDEHYATFEEEWKVTLKDIVLIMAIDPILLYFDGIGKHTSIEFRASAFEFHFLDEEHEFLRSWDNALDKITKDQRAIEFVENLLKVHGPFNCYDVDVIESLIRETRVFLGISNDSEEE